MKRRREIGPKREKNRSALIKYIIFAIIAAVVGSGLAVLADHFKAPPADDEEISLSFFHYVFVMIVMATIMSVLGLLFFGVRAYLTGSKARHSMLSSRNKRKYS